MKKLIASLIAITATAIIANAADVTLELTGNDQMQFSTKELSVTTGDKVTINFKHIGKLPKQAMGHNVVILEPGTAVAPFAMKCAAAAATDYIPAEAADAKPIVAHSKMIGGGEETSFTFTAPAPGAYPYICSFPGHFGVMSGVLTVKAK